jgi:hypothetical protein
LSFAERVDSNEQTDAIVAQLGNSKGYRSTGGRFVKVAEAMERPPSAP